jgi:hypothetical protein
VNAGQTFNITGANAGTAGTLAFTGVGSLTGGSGDDTFTLGAAGTLSGSIAGGGQAVADTLNLSGKAGAVAINQQSSTATGITGSFGGIEAVVGNGATTTITGLNAGQTFNITGADAGTAGTLAFTGVGSLTGGGGDDAFAFAAGGSLTGLIDGGAHSTGDSADYSLRGALTVIVGTSITNIESVTGTVAQTLQGGNIANAWNVTGANSGTLNGMTFTNFGSLTGGSGDDTFTLGAAGTLSGSIAGGGQAVADTLNLSGKAGAVSINQQSSTATDITGSFGGIEAVVGNGATTTITGVNAGQTFNITGANAGTAGTLAFTGVGSLTGGSGDDTFTLGAAGTLSGSIAGGGQAVADTLNLSGKAGAVSINQQSSTATGITGTFGGIEAVVGNGATTTITGVNAGQTFNITGADAGTAGSLTFTGVGNLIGGSGADTFTGTGAGSLAGVLADGSGATTLGGTIQTTGSQTYSGAVTLNAATVLTSAGGSSIGFANTLDGPFSLDVNTSGTTTFGGIVGGTNALAALTTNAGGTTAINGGSVTTTGAQTYGDAVLLGAATVLGSTGAGITGTDLGNSAAGHGLSLNTATDATLRFDSFTLGASTVGGDLDLTSSGSIGQSGPVTVTGTTALSAPGQSITLLAPGNNFGGAVSASGSSIQLNDTDGLSLATVTSTGNLAVTAGGLLSVAGAASGTTVSLKGVGLTNSSTITGTGSVTVDAGSGTLTNSGVITNAGAGSTAPIVLKGDLMALGGAVTGNAAPVTLTSGTAGQVISLIAGSGLILSQPNLNLPTTTGGLIVGDALHTGDIIIGGTVATPVGSSGGFTINAGYDGAAGGTGRILDSGGLLDMASAVTLKAHGNIGDPGPAVAPVHVGNVTSLSVLSEGGDVYADKTGALAIGGINGGGGQVFLTTTGAITQTGAMLNVGSLHATITGAGGVTLQNDLNTVDYLYLNAPGALAYHQAADYTVVQATGNGMDFSSHGNLNLAAVISGGPLNIDAGSGDVSLSTTGAISITGPGKVLGRNLNFTFANAVNFNGGSNLVNPGVSNDLSIKAGGNLLINAASLNIKGGTTVAGAGQNLKNDVVIEAGGVLTINTTGDLTLGGGTATTTDPTAKAQASAFLTANSLDLKVGGNFYIGGGTVNLGGGEANASGIVLVKSGKAVDITGNFVLTGGAITGAGTSATALAAFDPDTPLEIKTGGSVAVIGGTAPVATPGLLASASIQNAGPINFTIGGSGVVADPVVVAALGAGIPAGLIIAGGSGSGRYDASDMPVTGNAFPITYRFTGGGAYTVITDMAGYANGLVKSRAVLLGIDESLLGYINFSINTETVAKGRRGTSDQGNFKRKTAGQCS